MTTSTESSRQAAGRKRLDAHWRLVAERAQERALPDGRVVVSCPAPLGHGGLGRHLQEILEALGRRGQPSAHICESTDASDAADAAPVERSLRRGAWSGHAPELIAALTPIARRSPAWRIWAASVAFDIRAARELPAAEHLIAFNGTALAQLRAARRRRFESVGLVAANSHFRRVIRQHALAHRLYPVEPPWAVRLLRRNIREYRQADRIYVSSEYVRQSFVEEGVPEEVLAPFPLTPAARFRPDDAPRASDTFDVVYVGGLTVHKGVPLLLDAFRRLPYPDLRLSLVGGWKTRGMRRFVEAACAGDPRISVSPGDPLPHLRGARLCVHPAFEDGFAYAPAEALACGVPVIVSRDTGMSELVDPGRTGSILPTGERDALSEAIEAAYRGELLSG